MASCDICGCALEGYPNNASPFRGVCCSRCNSLYVVPARICQCALGRMLTDEELGGVIRYADQRRHTI